MSKRKQSSRKWPRGHAPGPSGFVTRRGDHRRTPDWILSPVAAGKHCGRSKGVGGQRQNGPGVGAAEAVKPLGRRFTPQRWAFGFWGERTIYVCRQGGRLGQINHDRRIWRNLFQSDREQTSPPQREPTGPVCSRIVRTGNGAGNSAVSLALTPRRPRDRSPRVRS
jgi:hypothetical protein